MHHPDDPAYQEGVQLLCVVRVGGVQVPFYLIQDLNKRGDDEPQGMTIYQPYTHVLIDSALGKQARGMAMFHELLHVISDSYGPSLRETQVRCLEMGFTQVLQDSPVQLSYILESMRKQEVPAPVLAILDQQKAAEDVVPSIDDRGVNLN